MSGFKFKSPTTKSPATQQKDGISAKKAVSEVIQSKSDLNPADNKPDNSVANSILDGINQLEAERKSNNAFCVTQINKILKDRETLKDLRTTIALDSANPAAKYAIAIQALLGEFDAGALFQITKRCDLIAKSNEQLGRQFLTEKVKPIICGMNVLIQLESNDYRWATYEELSEQLPASVSVEKSKLMNIAPLRKLRTIQQQRRINKARLDPYCSVKKDGTIKYHTKPFVGEMSEADKKLLREKAHAESEAKIRAEIEKNTHRKMSAEMMDAEKAIQQKELEIIAGARLKAAEINAKNIVRNTKLSTFKPVAVTVAVAAIAAFVAISSQDLAEQDETIQTAAFEQTWEQE